MALIGSVLGKLKKKITSQSGVPGQVTPPVTGQATGQEGPIMDSIGQFNLGSQTPGATAEDEETRTGRRFNRGVVDGLRQQRTAGRFGFGGGFGARRQF